MGIRTRSEAKIPERDSTPSIGQQSISTGRLPSQPASSPCLSLFRMSGPLPNKESTLISSICAGMSSPPKRIGRTTSLSGLPALKYANRLSPLEAPGLRIELRWDCASRSTSSGTSPRRASAAPRLSTVVVLPTPPFWLKTVSRVPMTDFLVLSYWLLREIHYRTGRHDDLLPAPPPHRHRAFAHPARLATTPGPRLAQVLAPAG